MLTNCQNNNISIYVHWPFCESKCPYCDFNSHVSSSINHEDWCEAYLRELDRLHSLISGKIIKSIFFGGGTPSLMPVSIVEKIISKIASMAYVNFNHHANTSIEGLMQENQLNQRLQLSKKIKLQTEITIEANPSSFEINKFKDLKVAGINRISIGVQALNDKDLKFLGRKHDASSALLAIESANKIFSNVSFDLIYARSGQDLKSWQEELKYASNFFSSHLSLYQLTIEKNTSFYKLYKNNMLKLPDEDLAADMYEWTRDYVALYGLKMYEISNYAKHGYESTHNLTYWNYESYLGIGPGAHSRIITKDGVIAIAAEKAPSLWLTKALGHIHTKDKECNNHKFKNADEQYIAQHYFLSPKEIITEYIMMGLRLTQGIELSTAKLRRIFNICDSISAFIDFEALNQLEKTSLLEIDKKTNCIKLTDKGMMLHQYILNKIVRI